MEIVIDRLNRDLSGDESRPPPPQTDAEALGRLQVAASSAARGLAASVLAYPPSVDSEAAGVEPADLRDAWGRDVFAAVRAVYQGGAGSADLVAVHHHLAATGRWDRNKLPRDIAALYETGGVGADVGYYVAAVRKLNQVLTAHAAGVEMSRAALSVPSDDFDPGDLSATVGKMLDDSTADKSGREPVPIGVAAEEAIAEIRRRLENPRSGLSLGFNSLAALIPDMEPGQLLVAAARPGVGKSAFALSVALHVAHGCGRPVYFVSAEMSRQDIFKRAAAMIVGVGLHKMRTAHLTERDMDAICRAAGLLDGNPLAIDDNPTLRTAQIAASARRLKRQNGLSLVVVDYLQLLTPANPRADRRIQVEQISRDLKKMAGELSVPVLALAQLNRESENRSDGKPKLSDLREAGGIEQDADAVIMLWRLPNQPDDAETHDIGCLIAKQRNGPTGEVTLTYRRAVTRFEDQMPRGAY